MFEKPCACGKSKKNFKNDIGPFFVNECCTEAGYDEFGKLKKKELDIKDLPLEETLREAGGLVEEIVRDVEGKLKKKELDIKDLSHVEEILREAGGLVEEIIRDSEGLKDDLLPEPVEETEEEKKARIKAEKEAKKKAREEAKAAKAKAKAEKEALKAKESEDSKS